MKKQKRFYRFLRYSGQTLIARREISYEIKLSTRLILDELCFNWNKKRLEAEINRSIDTGDKEKFIQLSKEYRLTIRE